MTDRYSVLQAVWADNAVLVQSLPGVHDVQISQQRAFLDRVAAGEVIRVTFLCLLSYGSGITELQDAVEIVTVPVYRIHERNFCFPCVVRQSGRVDLVVLSAPVVYDLEAKFVVRIDLPVA